MESQNVALFAEGMPFRATRMWNELVKDFKAGVRLKKKRWKMKYYHDCFSGSDALAWMHEYLKNNPNYGPNVTRTQAQLLCQKFLQRNVFKDILPSCHTARQIFDESRLYSFTEKLNSRKENTSNSKACTDSKENEHSRHSSAKMSIPLLKRRSSFSGNSRNSRKPFGERTGLTNITNECISNEKRLNSKLSPRKKPEFLNDKNNPLISKNPVTSSVKHNNSQSSGENCKKANRLSKKWKSECDVSLLEEKRDDSTGKSAVIQQENTRLTLSSKAEESDLPATDRSEAPSFPASELPAGNSTESREPEEEFNDLWREICVESIMVTSADTNATAHKYLTEVMPQFLQWTETHMRDDTDTYRLEYALNIRSLNNILDCNSLAWENVKENVKSDSRQVIHTAPSWVVAAMKFLIHWPNSKDFGGDGPDYLGFEKDVFKTVSDHFQSIPEPLLPRSYLEIFTKISGLATKCKLSTIRALQHTLLLLEKNKRQKLQLLLRFMIKVSRNHLLNLSKDLPTRELQFMTLFKTLIHSVIQTFVPCIFGEDKTGLTEVLGIRITSFFMDNYCEVFKVPEGLQYQVEQKMAFLRRRAQGNIKCQSGLRRGAVAFCQRVTDQEYEEQKRFVTQRSLEELLNVIVNDENISGKERTKKLKQFQKTYPEIYFSHFPGDGLSMMSQEPVRYGLRQVMKPLGRIKVLR